MRGKYTEDQLQAFVRQHATSGLSASQFCKDNVISLATFTRAMRRASNRDVVAHTPEPSLRSWDSGGFTAEELQGVIDKLVDERADLRRRLEAAQRLATPVARPGSTPQTDALRREVRALRKMLADQWGLTKAS